VCRGLVGIAEFFPLSQGACSQASCRYGRFATCCPDLKNCCPPGYGCVIPLRSCMSLRDSSVLGVQAILLVNSTDKRCHDGSAGMDPKVSKIIPSQQVETASKKNGFIGTSGDVFYPNEKYQCPDGTSICELSSGIYGCCHLVRGYVKFWQENSCFHYRSLNQSFSRVLIPKLIVALMHVLLRFAVCCVFGVYWIIH